VAVEYSRKYGRNVQYSMMWHLARLLTKLSRTLLTRGCTSWIFFFILMIVGLVGKCCCHSRSVFLMVEPRLILSMDYRCQI